MKIMFAGYKGWYRSLSAKMLVFMLVALIVMLGTIGIASASALGKAHRARSASTAQQTQVTNGSEQWSGDVQTTPLAASHIVANTGQSSISPLFTDYYERGGNASSLGKPLTAAFPIEHGWLQFFEDGALFLPTSLQTNTLSPSSPLSTLSGSNDGLNEIVNADTKGIAVGVVRLTLLQALLTAGSLAPIGGEGSTLTYADIRAATGIKDMVSPPTPVADALNSYIRISMTQSRFVKGGVLAGKNVGHMIAQPFWSYISSSDPTDWQEDIGVPLTEALPFTTTQNGSVHHMLVQVFSYAGLLMDQDATSLTGEPVIHRLNTGLDYLRTFGLPSVALKAKQSLWAQGASTLLDTSGNEIAHVGQSFPLTALGNTQWINGALWYSVQWTTLSGTNKGWVNADTVTFTPPTSKVGQASFDIVSPDLKAYLDDIGPNVSVALYDVTHSTYYTYNSSTQFIVASSMKVPIMLTFLNSLEQQGRDPDDNEMSLLTTMIENSNNDSASALFDAVGGASGIASYMQSIRITGLSPNGDSWGYSLITPSAMVNMLTLLYQGKILSASHRMLALNLMENIEADQQAGIGDTAPDGATVAMKDGWVTGPDNLWAMNSSGIVTTSNETYILAVYTQEQSSLDDGKDIARHVCSTVASLLAS